MKNNLTRTTNLYSYSQFHKVCKKGIKTMRINELELENFNGVLCTMETTYIKLDLRTQKNKICLITGPNGKGKTVLLSQLNPFATLGNLDVRDNLPLIIPGKKGKKHIVIQNNEYEYDITHFYTPSKDTFSVKSYIKKNGEEMNPNGNVTMFKELVKQELDMEQDYMKLVRLGNNVTNLIDLKSTERKNFMSKILEELNVYLMYYKKVNADVLSMKTIISHLINKEKGLGITDISICEDTILNLQEKLSSLTEEMDKVKSKIGIVNHEISKVGDIHTISDDITEYRNKLKNVSGVTRLSISEFRDTLTSSLMKESALSEQIRGLNERHDEISTQLNNYLDELDKAKKEYDTLVSGRDIEGMLSIIDEMKADIKERKKYFKPYGDITYKKSDVEELILFLKEKQEILTTTYHFGQGPISDVVKLMKKNKNVLEYVEKKIEALDKNSDIVGARNIMTTVLHKYKDIKVPCNCRDACTLNDIFNDLSEIAKDNTVKIENEREYYSYMNMAYLNIKNVILSFSEKKELFERLPKGLVDDFVCEKILDKISKLEWIYDSEKINNELSFITDYENFLHIKGDLKEKEEELESMQKDSYFIHLTEQIKYLTKSITDVSFKKNDICSDIQEKTKELDMITKSNEQASSILDTLEKKEEIEQKLKDAEEKMKNYDLYSKDLGIFQKRESELSFEITSTQRGLENEEYKRKEYLSIHKELSLFQEEYDKEILVKEALSTKEGIPLLFIDLYLSKAKNTVNDLLEQIYEGNIYIKKFDIRADRFDIPFVKNNRVIDDIRYASQGEQSFFSIALSFALAYQSMSTYNIMLLDELDSVLDEKNRSGFIAVIEKLIDMIGAEQIFIISHNNMFSMYPVDIISVIDNYDGGNYLTNYIPIQKSV